MLAELQRAGTISDTLRRALLLQVTVGDTRGHQAGHYARAVIAQAYRRGYASAAVRLAQHANKPPTPTTNSSV